LRHTQGNSPGGSASATIERFCALSSPAGEAAKGDPRDYTQSKELDVELSDAA
jgi:hypothetical protein